MTHISKNIESGDGYRGPNLLGWLFGRGDEGAWPSVAREELTRQERFNMRHRDLLQQICDFLSRAGLDPIPDHYELAWLYIAGASFSQRHMIESHMLEHGGISPMHAGELLDRMRSVISERELSQMVEVAKADILSASETTDQSGRDAADFGLALGDTAPDLGDPAKAIATLQKLQRLTADMVDRAAHAEAELKARSKTMSQLRGRLAQSQKQAMSDALTDLPNRRAFDMQLEQAIETAQGNKAALSVAFCDIDHFKRVNDSHGHATGDRVIRHVAQILKSCAGAKAHVARHGGEEYALLFEGLNATLACEVLQQARARLDAKRLVARDSNQPIGEITISCGVATLRSGETATNLLGRADEALYDAKNSGRNRIVVSPGI